ncbi:MULTISPECIES: WXG100 family type VII secretion target [Actinoalloteichus]|uniref:Uncharacterized protein n=1 Tax=Actinoalloteichus fjordicus TaxID=1612552 RepID=A0AAC9PQJ8_9PSEU|nr:MULTISPECIES: hypothetical protein [Actinoalloteichus]APU13175.1 hypothetical protein UA74_05495 [Actinoalloteichus fjordicus]APU19125.1 hypothetical protein UA75_05495 [Actinoalloteichus sp. GBA129-24]
MSNPLVADVVDSSSSTSGLSLVASVNTTTEAVQSGDWLEAGLGVADLVLSALDPFATIISNGVGWLIEHVGPLSDALDALAGNPDEIRSHAETWSNVAGEVGAVSFELGALINNDTATWTGAAADAYRERATDTANLILAAGTAAQGAADGIQKAGEVVSAVRDAVRDIIADVVGSMVSWALQVLFTLGIGLIWVVPKVVAKVAQTAATIAQLITKLTTSLNRLKPLLGTLGDDFATAARGLKAIKPGDSHTARALDAPTTTPTTARSGGDSGPLLSADPGSGRAPDITPTAGARGLDDAPGARGAPAITPTGTRGLPDSGPAPRSAGGNGSTISSSSMQFTNRLVDPYGYPIGSRHYTSSSGSSARQDPDVVRGVAIGPDGRPVRREFYAGSVRHETLRDRHGRTIGVGFPSKPQDSYTWQSWSQGRTSWKREYWEHPTWTNDLHRRPAPWAGDVAAGYRPFAVISHSNGRQFTVQAPTGRHGEMENLMVSPEDYRKIVTGTSAYQNTMTGTGHPLILMACKTGREGNTGASRFADALYASGERHRVFAPTEATTTGAHSQNGERVGAFVVDTVHPEAPGRFREF